MQAQGDTGFPRGIGAPAIRALQEALDEQGLSLG